MKLYYFASCRFCQRVFIIIDELGIQNQVQMFDILKNPEAGDELEKISGSRQVPCLVVDGKPIFDSMEIVEFLKKTFPKK